MKPWPEGAKAVICGRVNDPYRKDVPGSKVTACWHCGEAVMISPVTAMQVSTMSGALIICVQCIRGYYDQAGLKMIVPPDTPEQIAEQGKKRNWEGTIFEEGI